MTNVRATSGTPPTTPGAGSASVSPDPSKSSASPAALTTTPKRKYGSTRQMGRPKGTMRPPSQAFRNDVAALRAEGMSRTATAKLLGVGTTTIQTVERLPDVSARIKSLRERWQDIAHEKMTGMATEAWGVVTKAAQEGDARALNSAAYAMLALEKTSASVAGVGQKVEISGIPESPKVEVKAILAQLFRNVEPA